MGCRPVAVVVMHVHKYEIRTKKFKSGGLHEKHAVATWESWEPSQHSPSDTRKPRHNSIKFSVSSHVEEM
jgi:hypothetical protein